MSGVFTSETPARIIAEHVPAVRQWLRIDARALKLAKKFRTELTQYELAPLLGVSVVWLRHGRLPEFGSYGPPFEQRGHTAIYHRADVFDWLIERARQSSTQQKRKSPPGLTGGQKEMCEGDRGTPA